MTLERALIPALSVASALALIAACFLGSTHIPADRLIAALLGQGTPSDTLIVWQIRLPRALAAFVTGVALGASGAALQGLLRNPLAEPGILGVSASAALMATLAIFYGATALAHGRCRSVPFSAHSSPQRSSLLPLSAPSLSLR